MDDRYAKAMEQAERVLQIVAERTEKSLRTMAARTPEARAAAKREKQRRSREAARRFKRVMIALAAIFVATVGLGIVLPTGIGILGLLAAIMVAIFATFFFSFYPKSRREVVEVNALSNAEVVHRLDARLIRERPALPAPALSQIDAISAQLPLLEKRLETLDPLDPLAQDARRLMGQHLPDLLDRYEKVPAAYRAQQDGGGMSVEDRLISGLGAARTAIDDIGEKLTKGDLTAFETQGRFIESRYKDGGLSEG